jgi:hypothetical protein
MLEQMYLITVPKISVLGPNCWETTTEFSEYINRMCPDAVLVTRKFGRCLPTIRLLHVTLGIHCLVQLFV